MYTLLYINTAESFLVLYTLLFQNIFNKGFQSSFQLAVAMADIDRSSDNASADSKEKSLQTSTMEFSEAEEILIAMVYNLVGERWSLIAGRIPGRTAEEIEKYWTSRYSTSQ
ncbi:hypothetical protein VIGAN_06149000 [Vigna angularis var. angularis]|uniref:Uncharacterized protein n=2 Tax=Phaseolus angularis TaxID=3914 RepID=A0A0S3SBM7_PHAAN|nr:MYB-like transcription factor ETC3 [Vigna angularis]BAT90276.1 hypothetical protein VIGAN_06149000 [Vigna angularis var. angularis]